MKSITHKFISNTRDRLDKTITKNIPNLSRGYVSALIKSGNVTVNEEVICKPSFQSLPKDKIIVNLPPPKELTSKPLKADLDIIFENNDILAINKPTNLCVHPSHGHTDNTLINILLYHYPQFKNFDPINNIYRPGIVHRLDKDTSGLLVIAKNQIALNHLQHDLKNKKWIKKYYALVLNDSGQSRGTIDQNIIRSSRHRKKYTTTSTLQGKTAVTHYQVIQNFQFNRHTLSLVDITLETGRTHQIRVHLTSVNMPIIGDQIYCNKISQKISKQFKIKRQLLHAYSLKIINPTTKRPKTFKSSLPQNFQDIISSLQIIKF
ncbi:RluA family pseudouridine synthase [Patescibacteria group bacterium]|nr:RluA family pseudouridine synthase [Patescibacteria group bacterium]